LQISKFDKYGGRYVGDILVNISDHKEPAYKSLSETLLEADLVKPYTGSMKQPWESTKLRKIVKEAK
jgi:tryptophan synthase beta subunit